MNDLYFRCEDCKCFIDAGYRWAFSTLVQPAVVALDDFAEGGSNLPTVSVAAVLAAAEYWQAPHGHDALVAQLNRVKQFLSLHDAHRLSFGDLHRLHHPPEAWLEWLGDDGEADLLPRYLVEVLGFSSWGEVQQYVERLRRPPWWWSGAENRLAARRRFEKLAQGVSHGKRG